MKSSDNKVAVSLALFLFTVRYYVGVENRYTCQKIISQILGLVVPLQFHGSKTFVGLLVSVPPQLILHYTPLNTINDPFSSQVKHSLAHKTFPFLRTEFNLIMKKKDNLLRFGLFIMFLSLEKPIK